MYNYSTALSHLVLAGTGIYCLAVSGSKGLGFPQGCFGVVVFNSILGVWRYGNPSYGDDVDSVFKVTTLIRDVFALPCLTTTIWLNYGYMWELAYAHTIISLIPIVAYFADKEKKEVIDGILGLNCLSMCIISIIHQNYYGIATALEFAFDYFVIKKERETYWDIPTEDLYNYALCFFCIFGLKAIHD